MLLAAVIVSFFLGLGMIENEEPIRELVLTGRSKARRVLPLCAVPTILITVAFAVAGRSTVLFPPEVYEAASNPPNLGIDFDEDTELLLAHGLSPAARRSVEPPPSAPKLKVDVQPRQSNAPDSDDDDDYQEIVVSRGTVLGSMGSTGYMVKQHYRFENVQLSADGAALHFYYDPGFKMPMEHWVDTIFNNATSRELPTMTMMREGINGTYRYLKIDYLPAEEAQPTCTQWIEKPVYVVQLQHNENIWHVWTDGLMGAFQTLREQGLLPLAQVDADGRVAEYSEGVGDGCQWILDQETKKSSQEYPGLCRPRTGLVKQTRCDLEAEYWCKEGVVVVDPKNSPMLLMFNGTEILDKWEHMYYAISQDIRTWDEMNGTCFREIYLGKSNTLNFYMPLLQFFEVPEPEPLLLGYSTVRLACFNLRNLGPRVSLFVLCLRPLLVPSSYIIILLGAVISPRPSFPAQSLRSNATQAFKALIGTAEKVDYQARQVPGNPEYWESYPDPSMERLRVGIGPEDMDALDYLRPSAERARELGEMRDRELEVLER